jgi:hypothetical protein
MSTKEFKVFNRSNRESSWIAAESARLACIQNENRLRMLRGDKQLLSEKSKAVHESAGDMIHVSVGDSVCSGLKCNVVRDLVPPTPPAMVMGSEIEAAIAKLEALFVGSKNKLFITYFNMSGDGSPGSCFKLRVHVGPGPRDFSFHATTKGWLVAKQVNGPQVRYESEIRSDRRFANGFELRNPQNDTLEGLACMSVYLHATIAEAVRAEVRPHISIWTDCVDLKEAA